MTAGGDNPVPERNQYCASAPGRIGRNVHRAVMAFGPRQSGEAAGPDATCTPAPIARRETGVLPDALCGGGPGWGVARTSEFVRRRKIKLRGSARPPTLILPHKGGGNRSHAWQNSSPDCCVSRVAGRGDETAEFALDRASEGERRQVLEFRPDDLHAARQTVRNPDRNDCGR